LLQLCYGPSLAKVSSVRTEGRRRPYSLAALEAAKVGRVSTPASTPPERAVTIYDVAAAARVSASTVSRTFSRPGRVSVRTADHVRAVAERLGYRAEAVYRPVEARKHSVIGLTVADATSPADFDILRGAELAALESGYIVILIDAAESGRREQTAYEKVLPFIDGLIVASSRMSDTVLRGVAKSHPVVVLNRFVAGLPCVVPDNDNGVLQAVRHLLSLGYRQVDYVPGPDGSWSSGRRWVAVREAARTLGFTARRLPPVRPTVEGGYGAARPLIDRSGGAVVCYNDLVAIGLMRGLVALGARVPEDFSLIGLEHSFVSDLVSPALTTVASPMGLLGQTAVNHVLAMLGGSQLRTTEPVLVPVKLIERDSTAAALWAAGRGPDGPHQGRASAVSRL
jgi:LacI family transcriptional regulator